MKHFTFLTLLLIISLLAQSQQPVSPAPKHKDTVAKRGLLQPQLSKRNTKDSSFKIPSTSQKGNIIVSPSDTMDSPAKMPTVGPPASQGAGTDPTGTPAQYSDEEWYRHKLERLFYYEANNFKDKLKQVTAGCLGLVVLIFSIILFIRSIRQLELIQEQKKSTGYYVRLTMISLIAFMLMLILWLYFLRSELQGLALIVYYFSFISSIIPFGVAFLNYTEFIVKSSAKESVTKGDRISSLVSSIVTLIGLVSSIITIWNEFKTGK